MANPLVTILSPCYNVAQFLPKYFETVLGQTYSDLQVVLIDDGSKDNTWQVLQEYAAKDSRIEVYHQENQGVASTRNNLLDKVKGDYVLFVDSDDWIELDMVSFLVYLSEKYNSKFVMCDRLTNDDKPNHPVTTVDILSQEQAVHDFLRHEYFVGSLWNKLLGSSLLHNVRFHCGISYGEDALFCWSVLQKTDNVVVTNKQLYHYRMNDESISHNPFGPKKYSGHLTWQTITEETGKWWPQYQYIAKARWAVEDTQLIRAAAHSNYQKDQCISTLQKTVKENFRFISKAHISTIKMRLYAIMVARFYSFAKLF